jgi:hypothetical protein
MSKNKNPNNYMKYGGKPYVILCYAKMKDSWFTREQYFNFQLNRREWMKDIDRTMETLERNDFIESRILDGVSLYKITDWGKYALVALGETQRKKHVDLKASHMRANELKSRAGATGSEWDYDSLD